MGMIICDSHWDDADITASEEAVGFLDDYLQNNGTRYRWRSQDVNGVKTVLLDNVATQRAASLFGVMHHNSSYYGGFRVRMADSTAEITTNPNLDTAPYGPSFFADENNSYAATGSATDASWSQASFSISLWFRPNHAGIQGIVIRSGGTDQPTLYVNGSGQIVFEDRPNQNSTLTSTTTVTAGEYIHIVGTYNAGTTTAKLYINSVLEDTDTGATTWDAGTVIDVGPTVGQKMSGSVNELAFWNTAVGQAAIDSWWENPLDGTETNLLGLWGGEAPSDGIMTNRASGGSATLTYTENQFTFWGDSLWATSDLDDFTWKHGFHYDAVGSVGKAVQFDFLDTVNPDGFLEIGRLVVGPALETKCELVGSEYVPSRDVSRVRRSEFGGSAHGYPVPLKYDFRKRWMTDTLDEANALMNIRNRAQQMRDVVAIGKPDATSWPEMNLGLYRFNRELRVRRLATLYWQVTLDMRAA